MWDFSSSELFSENTIVVEINLSAKSVYVIFKQKGFYKGIGINVLLWHDSRHYSFLPSTFVHSILSRVVKTLSCNL